MRLFAVLLFLMTSGPALAFDPEPLHPSADRIAARLAEMPAFSGKGMVERPVKGLEGYRHITVGGDVDTRCAVITDQFECIEVNVLCRFVVPSCGGCRTRRQTRGRPPPWRFHS